MPLPASTIITYSLFFLPLLNFILGLTVGRRIFFFREAATGIIFLSFLLACSVFKSIWVDAAVWQHDFLWVKANGLALSAGFRIDKTGALMLVLVTGIASLVHLFSTEYIKGDKYEHRYWSYLGLFCFSMLGIVLSQHLLFVFVFWELVGFSSYLLIGFWFHKPEAMEGSQKAFILNRIGDVGFLCGILYLFALYGTTDIGTLASLIAQSPPPHLTFIGLLLFCGSIGKAAQFPLQTWLPSAMAGPTPVSALLHAATMVAAGVFFALRCAPFLTEYTLAVIAFVGAMTASSAAFAAMTQTDIKRVLAYSTLSQLGFMLMGVGSGAYEYAFFHLVTHAFFKCGLFLAAAVIIHSLESFLKEGLTETQRQSIPYDAQDMRLMGGLREYMPRTFWVFLFCAAALAGLPFFSGFLSKEGILMALWAMAIQEKSLYWSMIATMAVVASGMTAYYTCRQVLMIFFGRNAILHYFPSTKITLHDASWRMFLPLSVLAACSMFPLFSWNPLSGEHSWVLMNMIHKDAPSGYLAILLTIMALVIGLGAAIGQFKGLLSFSMPRYMWSISFHHFYQDFIYEKIVARTMLTFTLLLSWWDKVIIDGFVNRIANLWVFPRNTPHAHWAYVTLDTIFSSKEIEREFISLSVFMAKFDKNIMDGAVNKVADAFKKTGQRLRGIQNGKLQYYILISAFVFLALTAAVGWWIYKYRISAPVSVSPSVEISPSQREYYGIVRALQESDSIKHFPFRQLKAVMENNQVNVAEDSTLFVAIAHQTDSLSQGKFQWQHSDYAFWKKQAQETFAFSLLQDSLPNFTILAPESLQQLENLQKLSSEEVEKTWAEFIQAHPHAPYFYQISTPYFSQKQDLCILTVKMKCGGYCGGGHKAILVKENGKWQLLTKMYAWTS